jgi:hypothetical protein
MRSNLWLLFARLSLVSLGVAAPANADTLNLTLHPDDLGPFQPGVGGYIDYLIAAELIDSEGDGLDTQGLSGVQLDILTDTGLEHPAVLSALTGEYAYDGQPARGWDERYEISDAPEDRFVGGYGLNLGGGGVSVGVPVDDDRLVVSWVMDLVWLADAQPNRPGLQPYALSGIGYGERPAGGLWYLGQSLVPIPEVPGTYTVTLDPDVAHALDPDVDLSVDHQGGFRVWLDDASVFGDSFSFTVLPEPNAVLCLALALGLVLLRRR